MARAAVEALIVRNGHFERAALAPRRLGYTRRPSTVRAFRGDDVVLETALVNRKPLPLAWVEVWERIPLVLAPTQELERSIQDSHLGWLRQSATVWPYERVRWRHTLHCAKRGVFQIGEARVRTGDPFSLFEHEAVYPRRTEVIVYPRVERLRRLGLPLRHPSLDSVGARSLMTDPTRTAALREYRPGDATRLIHWPTTARRGSLQVRVLEPATSLRVALLIDVRGFQPTWSAAREALLEVALSALASIAVHLHDIGQPVGFFANADPAVGLAPGTSAAHLQGLLESMARLQTHPFQPLMAWALAHLPRGSTVIFAATDATPELGTSLAALEETGYHVLVLLAGHDEDAATIAPGRVLRISPERDLAATLEGHVIR